MNSTQSREGIVGNAIVQASAAAGIAFWGVNSDFFAHLAILALWAAAVCIAISFLPRQDNKLAVLGALVWIAAMLAAAAVLAAWAAIGVPVAVMIGAAVMTSVMLRRRDEALDTEASA